MSRGILLGWPVAAVTANPSEVVERPCGATLDVPPGFEVNLLADDAGGAFWRISHRGG